ncbi:S8 family peptidase [Falsiroseomonas sp. HC035]|uniref:S8 family peptidase n=1 Tax=Falsiroseomonas sp. HC035 TaxID=3390999 RepID=UPI003D322260
MSVSILKTLEAQGRGLPDDPEVDAPVAATTWAAPGAAQVPTSPIAAPAPDAAAPPAEARAELTPQATTYGGDILVQFSPGLAPALLDQVLQGVAPTAVETVRGDLPGQDDGLLLRLTLPADLSIAEATELLSVQPGVVFAEEDWQVSVEAVGNDASYANGSLWGMYGDQTAKKNAFGSQAGEAWADGETGSTKVVVGVLDSGINYTHADLYLNVWVNQKEIPVTFRSKLTDGDGDGLITFRDLNQAANKGFVTDINRNGRIDAGDLLKDKRWADKSDQDGNGYKDDLFGWDFVNNDNDPFDDNGHGTHVSGTIGAVGGNGIGVAGMAWEVQILALKFLDAKGSGAISNAVKALDYYTAAGKAAVGQDFVATNNSWGGGGYSSAMQGAIDRTAAAGNLFIAAAGNSKLNTDTTGNFPSNYSTLGSVGHEAVVSVAALTSSGGLASFSNYGATTVDLAAPGAAILSTTADGGYGTMSGTSMAAPHVTGAIALYAAANPDDSAAEIRAALLGAVTVTAALAGKTATGGRLDADAMLDAGDGTGGGAGDTPPVPPPPPPPPPPPTVPVVKDFYGTTASDTLTGTSRGEILSGVPQSGAFLGRGTIDVLKGLGGNDIFVLGDKRGVFYDDGAAAKSGMADYARIMDFQRGDRIQLSDDIGTYFLRSAKVDGFNGLSILADTDRNGRYTSADELVGHIVGSLALSNADFIFA